MDVHIITLCLHIIVDYLTCQKKLELVYVQI